MKQIFILICGFFLGVAGVATVMAAPGDLDTTFAGSGYDIRDLGSGEADNARAVAVQADGKIVVAGDVNSGTAAAPDYDFAVLRYNPDGTLDTT
ncbi:MAG: delta-60 repeat domain-containing protein, partial [Desulfosudaceae bacterium]